LRTFFQEAEIADRAVKAAQRSLEISTIHFHQARMLIGEIPINRDLLRDDVLSG